jgi:hypothetical protein
VTALLAHVSAYRYGVSKLIPFEYITGTYQISLPFVGLEYGIVRTARKRVALELGRLYNHSSWGNHKRTCRVRAGETGATI